VGKAGRNPQHDTVVLGNLLAVVLPKGRTPDPDVDHDVPDAPAHDAHQLALAGLEMQTANDPRLGKGVIVLVEVRGQAQRLEAGPVEALDKEAASVRIDVQLNSQEPIEL
jgi:hypothetical protein